MVEHDPLGLAGCSRGVDQRRQVVDGGPSTPRFQLVIAAGPAPLLEEVLEINRVGDPGQRNGLVEDDDPAETGGAVMDGAELVKLFSRTDENDPDLGVVHQIFGLLRGTRRVDRDRDAPE